MIVIGRKKLPDAAESGRQKYWGFVDRVVSDPKWLEAESFKEQHYDTATRGERTQPAAVLRVKVSMRSSITTAMRTSPMSWSCQRERS